jgi:uncharacterized repeat protein (TIGR03803 family)
MSDENTNFNACFNMKKHLKQLLVMLTLSAGIERAGAQTLVPLWSFTDGDDGANPVAGLVQANDGNLYGTTEFGGTNTEGTVFRITASGALTPLYSFTAGHDGKFPVAGLVQASDGNLYGTAEEGGTNNLGTIFRITTNSILTPLWSFTGGHDGGVPEGGLVQASDGYLYGTAFLGGTNGYGAVFRITTNGALTPFYSFTGSDDGAIPKAGLVQANDGNLYGTTEYGGISSGTSGDGTVFRITTNGVLMPLWSFTGGHDGKFPVAGLVQASDGNLYGTTLGGGTNGWGTVFRIATNDVFTSLYSFSDGYDGAQPEAGLVQANDGNLYGTTYEAGTNVYGTIFRITTSGVLTPLYSFTKSNDGAFPEAGLAQAGNGNLYGTADTGGTNAYGTVFEFIPPLPALNVSLDGNQSVLSWPAWANNYVLQSTTNLASPNWVTVSNVAPGMATVTNSLPAQFFRLAAP